MDKFKQSTLSWPLKIILIYLTLTLLLYVFGPFEWVTYKPVLFWSFNIIYILAFAMGWIVGIGKTKSEYVWDDIDGSMIVNRLKYLITIEFIYELIIAYRRFRLNTLNPFVLLQNIINGIFDMGSSYNSFQSSIDDVSYSALGGSAVTYFNLFFAFFAFNILMLGVLYFKQLSKYNKVILITTYVLIATEYVATGTNIGVFRLLLVFVVFYGISIARGRKRASVFKSKKSKRNFWLLAIIAVITSVVLFDKIMQSRGGILLWESSQYNIGGIGIDKDSLLFEILPSSLYMLLVSASSYLSQGYYGMSLCLRISWEPGFGVGHNMALMNLFSSELSIPHENSYQYRIAQFGWEEGRQWHTMYSWFANDVTFFGVIVIMFIIGLVFAMAYRDSVLTNNPYAKLVTYYFCLLAFFIPCNNQLFQSTYILFAFITALVLWLATQGKRIYVVTIGGKRI